MDLAPCELTYEMDENEVTFSWDNKAYADYYNLRVYKGELYNGEHFPSWDCKDFQGTMPLEPGHYYAYVDSTNAVATVQSNIVEFDIVPKPDKPTVKIAVQENKITVAWQETANTTHYNFWIMKKDDDGEYRAYGNQKQFVTSPYVQELPEGDYYVELQAYNSNGYANGDWLYTLSEPVYFTISNKPSIAMDMTGTCLRATATHAEQIIEHGIVCGPDSGVDLDSPGRSRIAYTGFDSSNGYTFGVKENKNYSYKAYAVWMEGTERKVIYSEEINPSTYVKEPVWSEWSDWTTTSVEANDHLQVRTKMEYSYSDKKTTTSSKSTMDGWIPYGTPEISYSG